MKKFFRDYGPVELESTESALDSTASWLRFAGYAAANGESGPFDSTHIW